MTQLELNTRLNGITADFQASLKGLAIDAAAAISTQTGQPEVQVDISTGSARVNSGAVLVNGHEASWSDLLEIVPALCKAPGLGSAVERAAEVVQAVTAPTPASEPPGVAPAAQLYGND